MKRLALIDGNSLINRAYYAMRNPMITKEGIYTHGIFGFINMMEKIRRDYAPEYMVIAFDMKSPTFRHEQYEEYKAGRKKMPPELAMEIPILKDILDALRITRLEMEGFEADDIIGTLARKGEEQGFEPLVFTGDRDQLQLATDIIKIIYTKRGVSDFDLFDHDAFVSEYGFTPVQFIDYKGLAGDSSDNIPGIPGVGAKTATKLIREYGSVEEIIRNVDSITPAGLQSKVRDNAQIAIMSKRLATIMTQVPLDIEIEQCLIEEPDYPKLVELYKKLEFNRFLSRLNINNAVDCSAREEIPADAELIKADSFKAHIIRDSRELEKIHLSGTVGLKVFGNRSHTGIPAVYGISMIVDGDYYYFDADRIDGLYEWFTGQLSNAPEFIGHELKDSYFMLMSKGCKGKYLTSYDSAIAQYVLDSARSNYSLSGLANEYLMESIEDEKAFMESNGQMDMFTDCSAMYSEYGLKHLMAVFNLKRIQEAKISEEGMEKLLHEVELPLVQVIAAMECEGFRADRNYLQEFGMELSCEIERIASEIFKQAGCEFNINSPVQLGEILFERLELAHGKKTKRGYSTSAEVLERIKGSHPVVPLIMEYRTLTKLKSTYIDGLIPLISEDGKIHAHFQQTVTATGRLSCTEPNLQNIPIRQELGRKLRKAFIPDENECILAGADYSQIELRVLAHMSEDEALIDAFNRGEDIHRATASNVLGIPEDRITPDERSRAKAVNFGVIYGMSSFGLSGELSISRKEAEDYIKAYFDKHDRVRSFMDDSVAFAKENGYVTTIMGRKRYIKEINASNYMVRQIGERLAMNSPIQGSAADIIKIAMIKVYNALEEMSLKSRLILQIHDELVINAWPDEIDTVEKLLRENMESALEMAVELKADYNTGRNWYELK